MRERYKGGDIYSYWICLIVVFYHLTISRKFAGFSPLWFPRWKSMCLVYLIYLWCIVVLAILSDKDPKKINLEKLTMRPHLQSMPTHPLFATYTKCEAHKRGHIPHLQSIRHIPNQHEITCLNLGMEWLSTKGKIKPQPINDWSRGMSTKHEL